MAANVAAEDHFWSIALMEIWPTITGKWAVKVARQGCFVKQRGGHLILRVKSDENKVPDELTATQPGFHCPILNAISRVSFLHNRPQGHKG